jgi:hypothetical protein
MSNIGLANLEIKTINNQTSNFLVTHKPSLPLTLLTSNSASVKVVFKPTEQKTYYDTLTITTNDSTNLTVKIVLTGKGLFVGKAVLGTLYGVSGKTDGGKLYSINSSNAAPTVIGAVGVPQVVSMKVHPGSKEMYGLDPSLGSSVDLLRFGVNGGNYFQLYRIPISNAKGMDFKNDSTIYIGSFDGVINAFNIKTGKKDSLFSTGIKIGGLAVNPVTKTVWISNRSLGTRDAIYKVNFETKKADLVGTTKLADYNSDLLFDKNGKLYGLVGVGTTVNKLISIDTVTGTGTLIGSLGIADIQSIALNPDGITEVQKIENNIPNEFALSQNYPNPFNPSTKIQFSIPKHNVVTLKIFDIAGREIATLLNKEMNAGNYSIEWNASHLPSGVYIYRITAGEFSDSKRMMLVK